MEKNKTEYFECECSSPEHILRVTYCPYDKKATFYAPPELSFEILLSRFQNIFKRMVLAFKYVFQLGNENGGYFDCCLFKAQDCDKLKALLDRMIAEQKEFEKDCEKYRSAPNK